VDKYSSGYPSPPTPSYLCMHKYPRRKTASILRDPQSSVLFQPIRLRNKLTKIMKLLTLATVASLAFLSGANPVALATEDATSNVEKRSGETVYLVNCEIPGSGIQYSVVDV
jgi:hypothetical protein